MRLSEKNAVRKVNVGLNSAVYQLTDFYTIFYHTFLGKNTTEEHFWTRNIGHPTVNIWYGLAYERICKLHMAQIKNALGIASVSTEYYVWRSKTSDPGAQIDLIIDRADNTINLCEVKYSLHEYTLDKEEFNKIMNRIDAFRNETGTQSNIIPTLITTFGLSEGRYADQIPLRLQLDDLFVA